MLVVVAATCQPIDPIYIYWRRCYHAGSIDRDLGRRRLVCIGPVA